MGETGRRGLTAQIALSTQVTPTFQPSAPDLANCHNVVQMRSCKTSRTPTSFRHLHCFNFFQHQVVKLSSTVYLPRSLISPSNPLGLDSPPDPLQPGSAGCSIPPKGDPSLHLNSQVAQNLHLRKLRCKLKMMTFN